MRNLCSAASAAAIALLAWTGAGQAFAYQTVVGGLAAKCSAAAKAGRSDPNSIEVCDLALIRDPLNSRDRAATHVNRGAMFLMNQNWEQARADFERALALYPDMGEAHIGLGGYLINQERFAEAEPHITKGLELGSEEPEKGYYFRGIARWGQDDYRGAYTDFQRAAQLKPLWSLPRQQMAKFTVSPAG